MVELKFRDRFAIEQVQLNRGNFLLLDSAFDVVPGLKGKARVDLMNGHWVFRDHFPDNPLFPASLMLEAMTQLAGLIMCSREGAGRFPFYTTKVSSFSVSESATNGDNLLVDVDILKFGRGVLSASGVITKENCLVSRSEFQLISINEFGVSS